MHNDGAKKGKKPKSKKTMISMATYGQICTEHVNQGDFVEWDSPPMLGAISGFQHRASEREARVTMFVSGVAFVRFPKNDRGPWPVVPGQSCRVVRK